MQDLVTEGGIDLPKYKIDSASAILSQERNIILFS